MKRRLSIPEEPYRILFDTNPNPMWVYDTRTLAFLAVNDAAIKHYGYSRDEFLGLTVKGIRPAEDVPAFLATLAKLRKGVERRLTVRHRKKDGSVIDVETTSRGLVFEGHDARLVLANDVTERKRAEDAHRQASETLNAVIDAAPLAIVAMDFEGKVRSWNRAAEHIFGRTQGEVMGRVLPIVPEDDLVFFFDNVERARKGETLANVERKRKCKDGTLIDVALWNAVRRDAKGNPVGVISVIADITDRKQLEEQLRQSQKMEAVGRLAGGVAHDFNNLLTVVTGFGQLILDELHPTNPLRPQMEEILKAGNRAAGLTNQLLAFSRRQMVRPRVLDLNRVVFEMEKMLRRIIIEDIDLALALSPDLPKIKCDRGQIEQVLMNLVVNARDAMPRGGKLVIGTSSMELKKEEIRLHPDLKPGHYVLLHVTDTGEGMGEETKRRLFEPFFTTKEFGKGTGLGLSTVYGIVKQNGGEVSVYSELGKGTTLNVYLPQIEGEEATEPVSRGATRGSETLLLVEDEAGVRQLTRELLERQGYTVLEACDGREAQRVYWEHRDSIDLLLTDVVMPGMSGQELAERLHKLKPALKVIFLSGYAERVIVEHGVEDPGAPTFLQKPYTIEALCRKVREVLGAANNEIGGR